MRRSRVESEPGNDSEGVSIARVNRDPLSASAAAVGAKLFRAHRHSDKSRARERVGDRARAIVGGVVKALVPAAESIRFGAELVRSSDCTLYGQGGIHGCQRAVAAQKREVARSGWPE